MSAPSQYGRPTYELRITREHDNRVVARHRGITDLQLRQLLGVLKELAPVVGLAREVDVAAAAFRRLGHAVKRALES